MKRSIIAFIIFVLIVQFLPMIATQTGEIQLPTAAEQREIDGELQRISNAYDFHVVIEVVDRPDRGAVDRCAQAMYEAKYGKEDGIMLLIATETRDWDIGAHGAGEKLFFATAREYIGERIVPELSSGDFYEAFLLFGDLCEDFLQKKALGTPYTKDTLPSPPLPKYFILLALGAGFVIAFFIVGSMKKDLESVAPKASAADYVRKSSVRVYHSKDVYLYSRVSSRTRSNGGGRSGGSRSRGNHTSGKF